MNKPIYNGVEKLEVEFHKVQCGIMDFTIKIGTQVFRNNFTNILDPLPDFKHWLEAITLDVEQTSFTFDNEGSEFKFNYERVHHNESNFTISNL